MDRFLTITGVTVFAVLTFLGGQVACDKLQQPPSAERDVDAELKQKLEKVYHVCMAEVTARYNLCAAKHGETSRECFAFDGRAKGTILCNRAYCGKRVCFPPKVKQLTADMEVQ